MNKYILRYRSSKGNCPCKTPLGEYITGTDIEDVNINSTWDWEYLIKTYGEKNLIILKSRKEYLKWIRKKIPWGWIAVIYIIILVIKIICINLLYNLYKE